MAEPINIDELRIKGQPVFFDIFETITREKVHAMWFGEEPTENVSLDEDGYLVGASVDENGYLIEDGIEVNEDYLQLKQ